MSVCERRFSVQICFRDLFQFPARRCGVPEKSVLRQRLGQHSRAPYLQTRYPAAGPCSIAAAQPGGLRQQTLLRHPGPGTHGRRNKQSTPAPFSLTALCSKSLPSISSIRAATSSAANAGFCSRSFPSQHENDSFQAPLRSSSLSSASSSDALCGISRPFSPQFKISHPGL